MNSCLKSSNESINFSVQYTVKKLQNYMIRNLRKLAFLQCLSGCILKS